MSSAADSHEDREHSFQIDLLLYGKAVEDILEMQRRQWNVVYYALLLMAAVVGVYLNNQTSLNLGSKVAFGIVLHIVVYLVVIASLYFLLQLQCTIVLARRRLVCTLNRLLSDHDSRKKHEADYTSFFRQWGVFCLFVFSICIGWELAEWIFAKGFGVYLPGILLLALLAPLIPAARSWAEKALIPKLIKSFESLGGNDE